MIVDFGWYGNAVFNKQDLFEIRALIFYSGGWYEARSRDSRGVVFSLCYFEIDTTQLSSEDRNTVEMLCRIKFGALE